jgi:hypothetical protein
MSVDEKDRTPDGPSRTRGAQPGKPEATDAPLLTPDDLNATPPHGDVTPPHGDSTPKDR